jgi:type VI protein secretion system component VasK
MKMDRRITIGLILAIAVQTGGVLLWAGAAAERLSSVEQRVDAREGVTERLARVETEIAAMRVQLDRIERQMEANNAN